MSQIGQLQKTSSTYSLSVRWSPCAVQERGGEPYRPKMLLLVDETKGLVVSFELLRQPCSPEQVREALLNALRRPAQGRPKLPKVLLIDNQEYLFVLQAALRSAGTVVRCHSDLPQLEHAYESMLQHAELEDEEEEVVCVSRFGKDLAIGFFEAAAEFYAAEPWHTLSNLDVLSWRVGDEEIRGVVVMGGAGEEFGVAVYETPEDALRVIEGNHLLPIQGVSLYSDAWIHVRDMNLIEARRYVFYAQQYPSLLPPENGFELDAAFVQDLTWVLKAVPKFVADGGGRLSEGNYALERCPLQKSESRLLEDYFLRLWRKKTAKARELARLFVDVLDGESEDYDELLEGMEAIGADYLAQVRQRSLQLQYFRTGPPARCGAAYRKAWRAIRSFVEPQTHFPRPLKKEELLRFIEMIDDHLAMGAGRR